MERDMAKAITEKFEELVLELETTPGSGTYARICGLVGVTVNRAATVDEAQVPDCDDESLPLSIERQVSAISVTVSGQGVWAQQSHEKLMDWFYGSGTINARIGNLNAATGDTEYETGPALLTSLNNARTKGQKVSAEIEIQFDGTPTRTVAA
jgi:hypothetical protein